MKTLLTVNLSTKTASEGGNAWTPPKYVFGEVATFALRFTRQIGGVAVPVSLDIDALQVGVGLLDARPVSGEWALQIGAGAQTADNTTDPVPHNCTAAALQLAINTKTAVTVSYGTATVRKIDGAWLIRFGTGGAPVPLVIRDNTLAPVSFGRISEDILDAVYRYEVSLVQAPVAFSDEGERILPPPPSVTQIRAGGTEGGFSYNEIQELYVPPDFRGTYQLRYGDYARTRELTTADGLEEIQAALAAAYGADFRVTQGDFQRARIEFVNELAGSPVDLIAAEALNPPEGDYTFTLALDRAELAARLRTEEEVTLPMEVRVQVPDDNDVPRWIVAFRQDITIQRPVTYDDMALQPGVDWLRVPSPKDYIPRSTSTVFTGDKSSAHLVGDDSATVFVIDHDFGSDDVTVTGRVNTAPGLQLVHGVDFTVEVTDANSVEVTSLVGAPGVNEWIIYVRAAEPIAAFAEDLEVTIGQVIGLQDELDGIHEALAEFRALIPNVTPGADFEERGTILSIDLPVKTEIFPTATPPIANPDDPALRGRRLLAAIHDAAATSHTTGPVPAAADHDGEVYQNNTGGTISLAGKIVEVGGYFGSDGLAWYRLSRAGTTNSYFPTDQERELWRIEISDAMLRSGKTLVVKALAELRTIAATTDMQCVLVVEWGNVLSQSSPVGSAIALTGNGTGTHTLRRKLGNTLVGTFTTDHTTDTFTLAGNDLVDGEVVTGTNSGGALPAGMALLTDYVVRDKSGDTFKLALLTTAANLEDIDWQLDTPLISQRIIVAPVLQPHSYGVTIANDPTDGITVDRMLYGGTVGVTAAPPEATFALRARLIRWDTRNPVDRPRGFLSYSTRGTAEI